MLYIEETSFHAKTNNWNVSASSNSGENIISVKNLQTDDENPGCVGKTFRAYLKHKRADSCSIGVWGEEIDWSLTKLRKQKCWTDNSTLYSHLL